MYNQYYKNKILQQQLQKPKYVIIAAVAALFFAGVVTSGSHIRSDDGWGAYDSNGNSHCVNECPNEDIGPLQVALYHHTPGNSTCRIRDNEGGCCPPVSICGGALADCNGCPNFGDAFTAPPHLQQVSQWACHDDPNSSDHSCHRIYPFSSEQQPLNTTV